MWTLTEAARHAGGHLTGPDATFSRVVTDSRGDCVGGLFVALRGERFDAHAFVAQAAANGAAAALVERHLDLDLPQWVVDDTRLGLGALAAAWRDRLPGRILAITGSNGKTTCKEMVSAILAQVGSVLATRGNLNNDIGMPLTLLGARDQDWLVLELGANHPGEIGTLTDIARPEAALICNALRAHLEGFGSVEGVARAKGEIAHGLPSDGTFVVPGDDPWTDLWRDLAQGRRLLTFGLTGACEVRTAPATVTSEWSEEGFCTRFTADLAGQPCDLSMALAGLHNVRNALAAAALTSAVGVPPAAIAAGLASLRPVPGRLEPKRLGGLRVIDDSYNANPDSVQAAIAVLVSLPGRPVLVLGDLGELGPDAARLHREVGTAARTVGVAALYAVGELCREAVAGFGPGGRHFPEQAALIAALRRDLTPADLVLIKGSRLAAMDRVVAGLARGAGILPAGQPMNTGKMPTLQGV
jgi:UDP-N-acetylmuramoyl-tripeptide--D-alanyl-D-alanine ligase